MPDRLVEQFELIWGNGALAIASFSARGRILLGTTCISNWVYLCIPLFDGVIKQRLQDNFVSIEGAARQMVLFFEIAVDNLGIEQIDVYAAILF